MTDGACTCDRRNCKACAMRRWKDQRAGVAHLRSADYLPIPRVAALLHVSRATVHYYITGHWSTSRLNGLPRLPVVRRHGDRGQRFVHRDALRQWLDEAGRWTPDARRYFGETPNP